MQFSKTHYHILSLSLLCFIGIVSSTSEDASVWQDIVQKVTEIAKDAGVPRAGEVCFNFLKEDKTCLATYKDGERVQILECNSYVGIGGLDVGICQVKAWIISIALALIVIIPLSILACICCCCCGCCRCRRHNYILL